MKILAQDSTPVRLTLGGDTVQLTAITQDVGNAAEEIDASYDGAEMTVAFNPDYLAAGIDAIDADDVTLATMDPDEARRAAWCRTGRLPVPAHARPRAVTRRFLATPAISLRSAGWPACGALALWLGLF